MQDLAGRTGCSLRHEDFGLTGAEAFDQLENARHKMRAILRRKKVTGAAAERASKQALDAAADYKIQVSPAEQTGRDRADEHLCTLVEEIRQLSDAIGKMSPASKDKLSRLVIEKKWAEFDIGVARQFLTDDLHPRAEGNVCEFRLVVSLMVV